MAGKAKVKRPSKSRPKGRAASKLSGGRLAEGLGLSKPRAKGIDVRGIRSGFGMSRMRFHRLSGFSERALANWEAGTQKPDENTVRRLVEMDRLRGAISRILQPDAIADWLDTPNEAFNSLKPIEVIERGETDRLWRMIVLLESGMPV